MPPAGFPRMRSTPWLLTVVVVAGGALAAAPAGGDGVDGLESFLRSVLRARGGDLGEDGTLTTLTPEGPVVQPMGREAFFARLRHLPPPTGADHTILPGTWGFGERELAGSGGNFPSCTPVYLYALVQGNPIDYYHANRSALDATLPTSREPVCGGWYGGTWSWRDVTLDLRRGTAYFACAGAMLLVDPAVGVEADGTRCGWTEACFSGEAAVNFWGPGFGIHLLAVLGQVGGIALGATQPTPSSPPLLTEDDPPCLPGTYPV